MVRFFQKGELFWTKQITIFSCIYIMVTFLENSVRTKSMQKNLQCLHIKRRLSLGLDHFQQVFHLNRRSETIMQDVRQFFTAGSYSIHCRILSIYCFSPTKCQLCIPQLLWQNQNTLNMVASPQFSTTECRWWRLFQITSEHPSRTWITCQGLWGLSVHPVFLQVKCLPLDS